MKNYLSTAVLRKNITRFAPLRGLYTVFMLLFLLLWSNSRNAAQLMNTAGEIMAGMGILNFAYAGLCALVLFGDLYTPRMCNMLHALPLRREGWFVTHALSGLLFCIVPNLLSSLIAAGLLAQYAYGAFLWLGLMAMQFLFFFGTAVFSALCAGSRLGAAAVYGITNFLAVLASWLIVTFYEPLLYGIRINLTAISRLSPVVTFTSTPYIESHYDNMTGQTVVESIPPAPWIYTGVAAAVGVALLVAALLIYRKRAVETAGDLISLKPLAPVFLVIYTLCVGAALYFISQDISSALGYVFLFVGLAVGFFTGRMLLEKKVSVFRGRNFLAFGILIAVFAASMGIAKLDPMGITRYVPEADQVDSVTVTPYSASYYATHPQCILTAPEDIETLRQLHRDAIENPPRLHEESFPVRIRYSLLSGVSLYREYDLPVSLGYKDVVQRFYSRPACVLGAADLASLTDRLTCLEFYSYAEEPLPGIVISDTKDDMPVMVEKQGEDAVAVQRVVEGPVGDDPVVQGLMAAVYDDCLAGTMSQWQNDSPSVGHIQLRLRQHTYYTYWGITIYENSENTLAFLRNLAKTSSQP